MCGTFSVGLNDQLFNWFQTRSKKLIFLKVSNMTLSQEYWISCKIFVLKGAMSRFVQRENFSLNLYSSWFVIRVNLLHP